jgi:hypothetical protein
MNIRPKIRNAALVGALAAAATAWATNESISNASYAPAYPVAAAPVMTTDAVMVTESPTVLVTESPTVVGTGIIIEERRLSEDERIQAAVMDKLASNPRLSGKIGVESHDAVVRLSGYTSTSGQAFRAGNEARSVIGVKYVQNEIRPRVGGSV